MASKRPYGSLYEMQEKGAGLFLSLGEKHWLEAFSGHPKIGDVNSLKQKYAGTRDTASGEQSGVQGASDSVLRELAQLNADYEKKFGFIFIVCATGKSASEMLAMLEGRLQNGREQELHNAAHEQNKITALRMEKLL